MATIKVAITNPNGKKQFLTILGNNTINEGKRKLGLSDDNIWKFNGMVLNSNKTFNDYEIEDGDVIFDSSNQKIIKIFVKDSTGHSSVLTILETCTINEGKEKLGISKDSVWKFDSMILKGDKTFKYYKIEDDDIIISGVRNIGGNVI